MVIYQRLKFNSLNAKLNPICPLLALLGAHHILHVSRIRVKCLEVSGTTEWQAIFIPLNTDTVRQCITTLEAIKGFLLNRILNIARKFVDQNQCSLSWTYVMTTLLKDLHVINPTMLGVTIKHRYNCTLTNSPD